MLRRLTVKKAAFPAVMPEGNCAHADAQATAEAAAKGQCGAAQANAQIVAQVGAEFNNTAKCEQSVSTIVIGSAVADAIAAGTASATNPPVVRMSQISSISSD
jgi:hypothetical protein